MNDFSNDKPPESFVCSRIEYEDLLSKSGDLTILSWLLSTVNALLSESPLPETSSYVKVSSLSASALLRVATVEPPKIFSSSDEDEIEMLMDCYSRPKRCRYQN